MESVIKKIIQSAIPRDCFFDAHTIINYLIIFQNDVYESFFDDSWTTAFYHSEISKKVASFEGNIIERKGESWSMNVSGEFSQNKCWIKL